MLKNNDLKVLYWLIIFSLLFIPITNSFFVSIKKLIRNLVANSEYTMMLNQLDNENKELTDRIKSYKTSQGLKTLIKDRLNKVEKGELLIKFDDKNGTVN